MAVAAAGIAASTWQGDFSCKPPGIEISNRPTLGEQVSAYAGQGVQGLGLCLGKRQREGDAINGLVLKPPRLLHTGMGLADI